MRTLCEKCSYTGVFFGQYFPIFGLNTDGESPYSVRIQENTDQKNSVFGHFLLSSDYKQFKHI